MAAQIRVDWDLLAKEQEKIDVLRELEEAQEKIDVFRELEEALSECRERGPTQDELNAVAAAKAAIKAGGTTSRKKPKNLFDAVVAAVESDASANSPMSLPSLKKHITSSMGTDFSKTASKNRLKKVLSSAVEQGVIQKEGGSYLPSGSVLTQGLLSSEAWCVDLGDRGLIKEEYGPWWFFKKSEACKFRKMMSNECGAFTRDIPMYNRTPIATGYYEEGRMAPKGCPPFKLDRSEVNCECWQFTLAFFESAEEAFECYEEGPSPS